MELFFPFFFPSLIMKLCKGRGYVATSAFVPFSGDPQERKGYVAILTTGGPHFFHPICLYPKYSEFMENSIMEENHEKMLTPSPTSSPSLPTGTPMFGVQKKFQKIFYHNIQTSK